MSQVITEFLSLLAIFSGAIALGVLINALLYGPEDDAEDDGRG